MASQQQLMTALRKAHDAGDTEGARRIAAMIQPPKAAPAPHPAAQPQQPQGNWFQRTARAIMTPETGNKIADILQAPAHAIGAVSRAVPAAINTYARPTASAVRGFQSMIPFVNHMQAGANVLGTMLGANDSNMSYSDRVRAFDQAREAEMHQDVHGGDTGSAITHYIGAGAGLASGGLGEAKVAGKLISKSGSKALAKVADLTTGSKLQKVAKLSAAGAASGAVAGASNTSHLADLPGNVVEGAAVGAVAAPATSGAIKLAAAISRPIVDAAGWSSAAGILRRYVKTTAEELQQRAADWKARTGKDPTIFEVLPLDDRKQVQSMLGITPSATKEKASQMIRDRAGNIGQQISDKAQAVIAPHRQAVVDKIATDLATSRGATTPTAAELDLAQRASRDPAAMDEARSTINKNTMAPHDATHVADDVGELVPQEHQLQPDGSVKMVESNPDVSRLIRQAAGVQNLDPTGVKVSDVTGMISKLRRVANTSPDFIQSSTASQAAQHLESQLPADAAEALGTMTEHNKHYKQMLEGWKAGLKSDLRENVDPTGNFQMVRNQFDTEGGAQGRLLGQASALDQQLSLSPGQSLGAASDIAHSPTTQEAISRNLADPNAGAQIADAAQAQTESARNLAELNPQQDNTAHMDLPSLASNLIRGMSFSPSSKAQAANNLLRLFTKLPKEQADTLVDHLFSQNPAKVSNGLKFLNNAGDTGKAALAQLQTAITSGNAGAHTMTAEPTPVDPSAEAPPMALDPNAPSPDVDPNASPVPDAAEPSDPSKSPYMTQLQSVYDKGDPRLLSLANIVQSKETANNHYNPDGTVKISPKGAVGLMQIMPTSLHDITSKVGLPADPKALHDDPAYNKLVGVHYLDQLLAKYGGDRKKAAAAYNAGPGAVDRALAADPQNWTTHLPAETQAYAGDL